MAKGRSGYFDQAGQRGSELDKTGIDGKPVHKLLEDGTVIRYRDAGRKRAEYGLPDVFFYTSSPGSIPSVSADRVCTTNL